jgi:hypothetical protein
LKAVASALRAAQVDFALGASGLLCSLGLHDRVSDWDLTTDAPLDAVRKAVAPIDGRVVPHSDPPFATEYRLAIDGDGPAIDLIGRFAIHTEAGICKLPTVVCATWEGVPVGSPEVWAVAYHLMQRHEKARMLSDYVRRTGARRAVVMHLLAQPLPPEVRSEVTGWRLI